LSPNSLRTHTRVYNNNLLKNKRYPVQKAGFRLYTGFASSVRHLLCRAAFFYLSFHAGCNEWGVSRHCEGNRPEQSSKKMKNEELKMKNQEISNLKYLLSHVILTVGKDLFILKKEMLH
ncbi:hypothetical protein, partial [Dysgonomonas sp.]